MSKDEGDEDSLLHHRGEAAKLAAEIEQLEFRACSTTRPTR
jgi:hypothetical protein